MQETSQLQKCRASANHHGHGKHRVTDQSTATDAGAHIEETNFFADSFAMPSGAPHCRLSEHGPTGCGGGVNGQMPGLESANKCFTCEPTLPLCPSEFHDGSDCYPLVGIEKQAEPSHNHANSLADCTTIMAAETYRPLHNLSGAHSRLETGSMSQMHPLSRSAATHSHSPHLEAHYEPFRGCFGDSAHARDYRKQATRFQRRPYRPPDVDCTVLQIRENPLIHVERIYNAMVCSELAKDNPNSIAMRRWVHSAYYPSALVEAYAHKVLDCLLELAEVGFRGWNHNDYALDERKSEDEDKEASCSERLESIIRGLQEEKTICEDVMNSACQIRMFVNAPRAYAQRKLNNRVGNSKRGRTTNKHEDGGRTAKARKFNPRPSARSQESVLEHVFKPLVPNLQVHGLARYPTPSSQSAPSPNNDYLPLSPPQALGYGLPYANIPPPRQLQSASAPPLQHATAHGCDPIWAFDRSTLEAYSESPYLQVSQANMFEDFVVADELDEPEVGDRTQMAHPEAFSTATETSGPSQPQHTTAVTNVECEFQDFWDNLDELQQLPSSQITKAD